MGMAFSAARFLYRYLVYFSHPALSFFFMMIEPRTSC